MKKFFHDNGLSLVLFATFIFFWAGQTVTGLLEYNEERADRGQAEVSLRQYFATGHFMEGTAENWESEFLQLSAYVYLTIFLFQRGSAESKDPDKPAPEDADPRKSKRKDSPGPVKAGGWRLKLYENSLVIAFLFLFLLSMLMHAIGGAWDYSEEELSKGKAAVSTWDYLCTSRFWFESFQNWQSEFLAIGCMVVFSIYLRQRGSPESKPVAAPHRETGCD